MKPVVQRSMWMKYIRIVWPHAQTQPQFCCKETHFYLIIGFSLWFHITSFSVFPFFDIGMNLFTLVHRFSSWLIWTFPYPLYNGVIKTAYLIVELYVKSVLLSPVTDGVTDRSLQCLNLSWVNLFNCFWHSQRSVLNFQAISDDNNSKMLYIFIIYF